MLRAVGRSWQGPSQDLLACQWGCNTGCRALGKGSFPGKGAASLSHRLLFPPLLLQEPPGADPGEETQQEMAHRHHPVFYLNPLYDANETET